MKTTKEIVFTKGETLPVTRSNNAIKVNTTCIHATCNVISRFKKLNNATLLKIENENVSKEILVLSEDVIRSDYFKIDNVVYKIVSKKVVKNILVENREIYSYQTFKRAKRKVETPSTAEVDVEVENPVETQNTLFNLLADYTNKVRIISEHKTLQLETSDTTRLIKILKKEHHDIVHKIFNHRFTVNFKLKSEELFNYLFSKSCNINAKDFNILAKKEAEFYRKQNQLIVFTEGETLLVETYQLAA